MTDLPVVQLQACAVTYFSELDEDCFFGWLKRIDSVKNFEGSGDVLYIYVDPQLLDEYDLRELLALFWRYDIDMRQLAQFDREEFGSWFRMRSKYWYQRVFG